MAQVHVMPGPIESYTCPYHSTIAMAFIDCRQDKTVGKVWTSKSFQWVKRSTRPDLWPAEGHVLLHSFYISPDLGCFQSLACSLHNSGLWAWRNLFVPITDITTRHSEQIE